jgi:hypothetical protein
VVGVVVGGGGDVIGVVVGTGAGAGAEVTGVVAGVVAGVVGATAGACVGVVLVAPVLAPPDDCVAVVGVTGCVVVVGVAAAAPDSALAGIPLFNTANHEPSTPCPCACPFFLSPAKR